MLKNVCSIGGVKDLSNLTEILHVVYPYMILWENVMLYLIFVTSIFFDPPYCHTYQFLHLAVSVDGPVTELKEIATNSSEGII